MENFFKIFKITPEIVKGLMDGLPEPHTHDHEEIIIATEGNYEHFIDFNMSLISAPSVMYVAQGKVHQFKPNNSTGGWVIRYSTEFVPGGKFHYYSHYLDNIHYRLDSDFLLKTTENICSLLCEEAEQENPDYETIKNLLRALFTKIEARGKSDYNFNANTKNCRAETFNNFLKILEENFRHSEGVEFYANKMNMTVRNLNHLSKSVMNKSVSEIIETRKLIEARNLLTGTNKSVSEIGFELGYSEKSYFTRVFRLKTGLTPSKFREKMQSGRT